MKISLMLNQDLLFLRNFKLHSEFLIFNKEDIII